MYIKTNTILDEICEVKEDESRLRSRKRSESELVAVINNNNYQKRDFKKAIRGKDISLIAEIKKSSPSNQGVAFRNDFDVSEIAQIYEQNGASAISVISDEKFFMGSLDYVKVARESVALPILRKDFIIGEYQVYEAKANGADAILLMSTILEKNQLAELHALAFELELDVLLEAHTYKELEKALEIKPDIIGINNRDLKTMQVSLDNFEDLVKIIPDSIIKVAESGIRTREDLVRMRIAGADAILVGTSLIKSNNIQEALQVLLA